MSAIPDKPLQVDRKARMQIPFQDLICARLWTALRL
jgi:hypothetical protein